MRKRQILAIVSMIAAFRPDDARADEASVQITPEQVRWTRFADYAENVQVATLYGGVTQAGIYTLRVEMLDGARLKIHAHPDTRMITVLSGILYAGRGGTYDPANEVKFAAGGFFVVPAGVPHYTRAGDQEVIYQENGFGPSPTIPVQ